MSFAFPLGLFTLAALAPLTAAYFLRRRQKPVTVSALFLWRTPHHKAEAGPRLERYSRELSFLLEVLAILAATAFIADLRWGKDQTQKQLVVLVDGDLSLSARPTTGASVSERVRQAVAKAAHDEGATVLTVVESGARPHVLAGPQARTSEALAALERWHPQGGSHELGSSFLLAKELAGPKQRLYFFTDRLPAAGELVSDEVEWVALGTPLDNVGFVAAQRRDEGETAVVTVRVGNFGRAAVRTAVNFDAHSVRQVERVEVPPDGTAAVRVAFKGVGEVEVSLPDDALAEDGHLTLLPSPARELEVKTLQVLGAAESAAVLRFVAVSPGLKPGNGATALTVGPPDSHADVTFGTKGALHSFVGPFFSEKTSAVLEDVDLAGVVWTAGDSPPGRALVTANDVALVTDDGETLHFNVDLGRSSLVRTQAWPILMGNLVRRARLGLAGFPQHQILLGDGVPVVTGAGGVFALSGPDGRRTVMGKGLVSLPPPARPGHYTLERDGKPLDELEVLPIDPRESDLRARASGVLKAKSGPRLAEAALARNRPVWPVLVLLLLLAIDFALTGRRRA